MPEASNALLQNKDLPRFDLIAPELAEPAITRLLKDAREGLVALEHAAAPTWQGLMAPRYRLVEPLNYAWGLISHYMSVQNSDEWRAAHEKLQPEVVKF